MSKLAHSNQDTMDEIEARIILADYNAMDAEANEFAMCLLMPEALLRSDLEHKPVELASDDDRNLQFLANKYKVPKMLMAIRIGQLFGVKP